MDELKKRLDKIRARAKELAGAELTTEVLAEVEALVAEREEIVAKISALESVEALAADPEPEAEPEAPAEEEAPAEDAPAEEAPKEELALAASAGITDEPDAPVAKRSVFLASASSGLPDAGAEMDYTDVVDIARRAFQADAGSMIRYGQINAKNDGGVVSSRRGAIENTRTMIEATPEGPIQSMVAAACFCDQQDRIREILSPLQTGRPFADLFGKVDVTGRFNYVRGLALSVVDPGVGQWTCVEQGSLDFDTPATWKPCVDLPCQPDVEVEPYAIYACGNVTTFQQVSSPELIENFLYTMGVLYERTAETLLLDAFVSSSNVFTYTLATKGLLHTLIRILSALPAVSSYGNRAPWSAYTLALPPGLIETLIGDEHLRGFTKMATREEIVSALRSLGVGNVVELLDVDTSAIAAYTAAITNLGALGNPGQVFDFGGATPNNIEEFSVYLVPTEAYRMGQRDIVDAGWYRDGTLVQQNAVRWFMESMEFLEKMVDVPSYTLRLTGCANGGQAALTAPESCN